MTVVIPNWSPGPSRPISNSPNPHPTSGVLTVYTETPGLLLNARFYQEAPQQTGGSGGFVAVQRPEDGPVTAWRGFQDGFTFSLNLIMDSYTARPARNIEADCLALDKMAGLFGHEQPPLLILNAGGALQYDYVNRPTARWVISDPPDYADVYRDSNGQRIRQVATVKFMLYVAYDAFSRTKSTARNAPKNTFVATTQVDTFKTASARYLKSYGGHRWANRLAQLNGYRDGMAKLPLGQRFKLPTVAQIKDWERTPRR